MVVSKRLILAIAVALIGTTAVGLWFFYKTGPKAEIRERCFALADKVSKGNSEAEGSVQGAPFEVLGLREFFADPCRIEVSESKYSGTYSPREIVSSLAGVRKRVSTFAVQIDDIEVHLEGEQKDAENALRKANVRLVVSVDTDERLREFSEYEKIRRLVCGVKKQDGKWRFTRIVEEPLLEK